MNSFKEKNVTLILEGNKNSQHQTILVTGVERGGTSMVAGTLRALGVNFGERVGRNHELSLFLKDDPDVLLENIKTMNSQNRKWGLKAPKISKNLSFFIKNTRKPAVIIVFRNISSIADSWVQKTNIKPNVSVPHALDYYQAALKSVQEMRCPTIFVNYERACQNPAQLINELIDFFGLEPKQSEVDDAFHLIGADSEGYRDIQSNHFSVIKLNSKDELNKCANRPTVSLDVQSKRYNDRKLISIAAKTGFMPKYYIVSFEVYYFYWFIFQKRIARIYLNFSGNYFPSHSLRVSVNLGKNAFIIKSNADVKEIGFDLLSGSSAFFLRNVSIQIL